MKLEISVPEVVEMFKEIQECPEKIFEMIRVDMRQTVGQYLTDLMRAELTAFLGRQPYERKHDDVNHRNGTYERSFALKGIGQVRVDVPRDRKAAFQTCVIPRSKQYENAIRQDLSMMFLTGISTRSLSLMSNRLIGRSIFRMQRSARPTKSLQKPWRCGGCVICQKKPLNTCLLTV